MLNFGQVWDWYPEATAAQMHDAWMAVVGEHAEGTSLQVDEVCRVVEDMMVDKPQTTL